MTSWSRPTLSTLQLSVIVLVIALSVAYSVLIAAQLLLAIGPLIITLLVYLFWRLVRAVEATAGALHEIADSQTTGDDETA